jgi:hypothetical protein
VLLAIVLVVFAEQAIEPSQPLRCQRSRSPPSRPASARLKDPDLAKFSGIVAKSIGGPILAVCGYANARNSSGGYIGDLAGKSQVVQLRIVKWPLVRSWDAC